MSDELERDTCGVQFTKRNGGFVAPSGDPLHAVAVHEIIGLTNFPVRAVGVEFPEHLSWTALLRWESARCLSDRRALIGQQRAAAHLARWRHEQLHPFWRRVGPEYVADALVKWWAAAVVAAL